MCVEYHTYLSFSSHGQIASFVGDAGKEAALSDRNCGEDCRPEGVASGRESGLLCVLVLFVLFVHSLSVRNCGVIVSSTGTAPLLVWARRSTSPRERPVLCLTTLHALETLPTGN